MIDRIPLSRRHHLNASDTEFIVRTLSEDQRHQNGLLRLLADPEELDRLLDDARLFQALLESPACVRVTPHLYFYVLLRQALRRTGLDDRDLTDYLAAVLADFAHEKNWRLYAEEGSGFLHSVDLLTMIQESSAYRRFYLYTFAGNHYLVLTGVFSAYVEKRERRRGSPGVRYYEQVARNAYRSARDHPLAREFALDRVFDVLSGNFPSARRALTDFSTHLTMLN